MKKYSGFSDEQHYDCGVDLNAVSMIAFNLYMKINRPYGRTLGAISPGHDDYFPGQSYGAPLGCEFYHLSWIPHS